MGFKDCYSKKCGYKMFDEHNQFSIAHGVVRSTINKELYEREVLGCIWRCPKCKQWQGIELYSQDEWEFIPATKK